MNLTESQNKQVTEFVEDYLPKNEFALFSVKTCTAAIALLGGWDRFTDMSQDCVENAKRHNHKPIADKYIGTIEQANILAFYEQNHSELVAYIEGYSVYIQDRSGLHYINHFAYAFPEFDAPTIKAHGDTIQRVFADNNPVSDSDHIHKNHIARFVTFDFIVNLCLGWYDFMKVTDTQVEA